MRKEARHLIGKSIDSLILGIEHFNRPWDKGRPEAVLIFVDRAFELFLKAAILHRGGNIREKDSSNTLGFEKCLRKCVSDSDVQFIEPEQAITIQLINSYRDAGQHYILDISEQQLYICIQAGVCLYDSLLGAVFGQKITDYLPTRILPVSSQPPRDFASVIISEFRAVKELVAGKRRRLLEARSKLRSLAIIEASLEGLGTQPSDRELDQLAKGVKEGLSWRQLFPGIATLSLDTTPGSFRIALQITKGDGEAVRLVPEGTPGAKVVAVKKVSELGFYTLGLKQIAPKVSLNQARALALIHHLKLQENLDCFKVIEVGPNKFKRYSQQAVDALLEAQKSVDMEKVWKAYQERKRK